MEEMDEWYDEDGREYGVLHYHGKDIYYNYYYENEYSIGEWWYFSLDDAKNAIDKGT